MVLVSHFQHDPHTEMFSMNFDDTGDIRRMREIKMECVHGWYGGNVLLHKILNQTHCTDIQCLPLFCICKSFILFSFVTWVAILDVNANIHTFQVIVLFCFLHLLKKALE